jgi:uncharacterized glyoxalase superfamily protein PhnB
MFARPQVNFYVQDVEASVAFYRDCFSFVESFRTPLEGPPAHAELRLDGFILSLATIEAAQQVHGIPAGAGPARAELVPWCDDVDRAYAALLSTGATTMTASHDFSGVLRAAWVADLDGHPIQLVMRLPARVAST